jgi:hypothetical protein
MVQKPPTTSMEPPMTRTSTFALLTVLAFGCASEEPVPATDYFTGPAADRTVSTARGSSSKRADLSISASAPAATGGGDTETVVFDFENHGSNKARSVEVTIDLPLEGSLASIDSSCSVSGAQAVCSQGTMNAGDSGQISVSWTAPMANTVLDFDAEISTSSSEGSTADNTAGASIAVTQATLVLSGGETFYLSGCMDTSPVTFADCSTLGTPYAEQLTLNGDGTITANTTANGFWSQPNDYSLEYLFAEPGTNYLLSYFQAKAVDSDCFEGIVVYSQAAAFGAFRMCMSGFPTP